MVEVMAEVLGRSMQRVPVTLLNIMQLTEHHVSIYTEVGGEQVDPEKYADLLMIKFSKVRKDGLFDLLNQSIRF
jgi:hypothetical protein